MTINAKCTVCKDPDRRRLIELGWNDSMSAVAISNVFSGSPSAAIILKHLKEHSDGRGDLRQVEVQPVTPVRERVIALQTLQLNEIERRIEIAKVRAVAMNAEHEGEENWTLVDWSDFYDILDKNAQAAIASIQKAQGLTDKRELKTADLKIGLFEAMARNGLAPKAISGVPALPALPSGEDDERDAP